MKRHAASDRKDKQVWGVEIMSSSSGILGGSRCFLAKRTSQAGGWTQESGHRHNVSQGELRGHRQMDGREALRRGEVTWGAGAGEAESGGRRDKEVPPRCAQAGRSQESQLRAAA